MHMYVQHGTVKYISFVIHLYIYILCVWQKKKQGFLRPFLVLALNNSAFYLLGKDPRDILITFESRNYLREFCENNLKDSLPLSLSSYLPLVCRCCCYCWSLYHDKGKFQALHRFYEQLLSEIYVSTQFYVYLPPNLHSYDGSWIMVAVWWC